MIYLKLFLIIFIGYSFTFAQTNIPQGIIGEISINDTSVINNLKKQVESLPIPEMVYPQNNATGIPIVPKFIIGTVSQANRYEMELSLDQSFFSTFSRAYWEFEESLSIDFLEWFPFIANTYDFQNNKTYYWHVKALNTKTNETSPWSQTFKYKTKSSGESVNQPILIYPDNNSNIPWLNVNFQWSQVNTSNWYQVQWGTSGNITQYRWSDMENPSKKDNIKPLTSYFWKVVAFNDNSISEFSLKGNFETGNFVTLTDPEGTFDDGSNIEDYENNKDIYYLIQPPNANNITLNFLSLDTEEGSDYVTIYDGSNTSSPELGKFSGNELPFTRVSTNGSMLVRFKTDGAITRSGWKAKYSIYPIKIEVSAPYLSNPYEDDNIFITRRPIDADTLALKIKLINQYPSILNGVNLQAKINNIPLNLHLKEINLDVDDDGFIDQIPANSFISVLATTDNGYKGKNENLLLETSISKINGADVNIKSIDTISYYTSLQPNENRTFDYFKDAYSFPNDQNNISYDDVVSNMDRNSILIIFYHSLWSSGGQCYGMAYTAGNYFINPSEKLFENYPYDWQPSEEVLGKIIRTQLLQYLHSSYFRQRFNIPINYEEEYQKVLKNIKMGYPTVLCMELSHAVLITELLKINNITFFEIYDNNLPSQKYQARYDINKKEFEYSFYKNFSIDELPKVNKMLENGNLFISSFVKFLSTNSKKVFATVGKTNFLLNDSFGRRIGYLENGNFVNEIEDSWIYRLPAENSSKDSVTVFYVPNDEDYEIKFYNYGNSELRFENHIVNGSGELTTYWIDSVSLQQNSVCYYDEKDQTKSLLIDYNNDGTIDSTISTIETVTDLGREIFNNIIPSDYYLSQNYPNPFNPSTKISYSIPHTSFVSLKIYDILGREIRTLVNEEKSPGNYEVEFYGSNLSSGIYFYRIQAGGFNETKKFILLK